MLAVTAMITVCYQALFFMLASIFQTDKFTDFAGTSNILLLAATSLILGPGPTARKSLVTVYVTIWASRLCSFLLMRILHWGRDRRFDEFRKETNKIVVFWIMQSIWVWVTSLPTTLANSSLPGPSLSLRDFITAVIVVAALVLEAVADMTKLMHNRSSDESSTPWVNYGIWAWSRHPNYFAEMVTWWMILFASWPDIPSQFHLLALLSPIFVTCLLLFISGLPVLEKSADRKYARRPDYIAYKKSTSILIPIPPYIYKQVPEQIKKSIFLDFDMYSENVAEKPIISSKEDE